MSPSGASAGNINSANGQFGAEPGDVPARSTPNGPFEGELVGEARSTSNGQFDTAPGVSARFRMPLSPACGMAA